MCLLPEKNCSVATPTQVKASSELIFRLVIPGRLPSWNAVLAMSHWQRKKFKDQIAKDFLSALEQSGNDCLTNPTFAKNFMKTYAATPASCLQTHLTSAILKSRNKKLAKMKMKESKSK